jgi:hypothetical protein
VREIGVGIVREWRVFFARKEAVLQQLRAIEIHGLRFYDIVFTCTDPPGEEPEVARVGNEMIYPGAQPGDRILVEKIANVVSRVQKL